MRLLCHRQCDQHGSQAREAEQGNRQRRHEGQRCHRAAKVWNDVEQNTSAQGVLRRRRNGWTRRLSVLRKADVYGQRDVLGAQSGTRDAHAVEQAAAVAVQAVPRCVRKEAWVERGCAPRFARGFSTAPMPNWRSHFASAIDGIRFSFIPHPYFYCRETSTDYAGTVPRFPSEVGGGFLPRHLTQLFGTAQRCDRSDELFLLRKEFDWRDPLRLATARFAPWHGRAAVARYGYRRT